MITKRLLLLLLLCWALCLTALHAQYSDMFVGKKGRDYIFVNIQLPVSRAIPPKFDRWLAQRLFMVKDSSLKEVHQAYIEQYERMLKPTSSILQKAGNNKDDFTLRWNSYVEGRYASFYMTSKIARGKGKSIRNVRGNYLYDLMRMRNVKLEDIFQMQILSDIYENFKGSHYEPIIRKEDTFVLQFRDEYNQTKEATFNMKDPQVVSYFKPYFLNLMGIDVPKENVAEANSSKVSAAEKVQTTDKQPQRPQMVQQAEASKQREQKVQQREQSMVGKRSIGDRTFVIIIANENYQEEQHVEFAINDGEAFRNCCMEVLGIPEENIHLRRDATLNNIRRELHWLKEVSHAYDGDIRIIVYYAGHGMPDEKTQESYLLPVDGIGTSVITGYKLEMFYHALSQFPSKETLVFLDACFSGTNRGQGMLTSARGVALKPRQNTPEGNLVVFSAAQGDETAYPFREKQHGLFTYFLLEKLRESKGAVSLEELRDYVCTEVMRKSVVVNGKKQTPTMTPSSGMFNEWKNLKMK